MFSSNYREFLLLFCAFSISVTFAGHFLKKTMDGFTFS